MERTTSFGYWLRRRRKALDLTQDELARQVGCAVGTIKKLEGDERRPSKQLAERLADLLAIPPDERVTFLKTARAELATDQLDIATQPVATPANVLAQPMPLPASTVTFLFTDIEASTELWAQHHEAMRVALARHDALLRQAIEAYGGVVFKTVGDAFYATFATAADALVAALAAQRAIHAETKSSAQSPISNLQSPIDLRVRMALHTGTAETRADDYFGHTLSRVARLLAAGHGGQVLLSAATWELVRDHLPPDTMLRDLGAHWLKSLPRPEQIYQLVAPDLPSDFAPLATLARPLTNLPAQTTTFIGREREVTAVCDLLRRAEVRLVTLTGPGGAGKTRLSLQAAADLLDTSPPPLPSQWERGPGGEGHFPNGIWFVNLAPLSDPGLVASAIAQALDVRETGGQPLNERLKDYLRAKQLLLLLDNFEQVVDAAPLVGELLAAASGLKVLVTSRMPLHLSGEREYAVPPLGLPPTEPRTKNQEPSPTSRDMVLGSRFSVLSSMEELTQYEAVRLFIERAQAIKADFAVTNANAPAVAEICYRLDGLPLAIELAAAWIKLFPPQALLARLNDRLKLLTGGARDLPARQQTIRNTIDWSYHLLDAGEQTLFARLGVFVGGCTIEAAETVCELRIENEELRKSASDQTILNSQFSILNLIAALVDKSLLKQVEGIDGEPRFIMLETIREYALERLTTSGEAEALRRQHAEYCLELAEMAEPKIHSPEQQTLVDRLEMEHDNLRAALAWSQQATDVEVGPRLAGALHWFWFLRGYYNEGRTWLENALARSSRAALAVRAKALRGAGRMAQVDDLAKAHALYEESLKLLRKLGDKHGSADLLNDLAWIAYYQGDATTRLARSRESLELYRQLDDRWGIASALLNFVLAEGDHSNYEQAQKHLEESLALFRQFGDIRGIGGALVGWGSLARVRGDDEQAIALFEESLALFRQLGDKEGILSQLANLGYMAYRRDDSARMAACFREGLLLSEEIGDKGNIAMHLGGLAGAIGLAGRPELAGRLFGAADALLDAIGQTRDWIDSSDYDRIVATVRTHLSEGAFAMAWEAGRGLTLEQAIEEALAGTERVAPPAQHNRFVIEKRPLIAPH
jgi:predicted ATPase/class 3 adenylate cyclase